MNAPMIRAILIGEKIQTRRVVKHSLHLPGGRFARENFAHLWWTINGDGYGTASPNPRARRAETPQT
jgi:hypothetical protein